MTKTGKDPRTTRKYAGNVITQENVRSRYLRMRSIKSRAATLKGRDGQSLVRLRGGLHATWKWHCLEQHPYRDVKKQKHRPHALERDEAEILRHPDNTPAAHPEKSDFRECRQQAIMSGWPAHENAQVKEITVRPPKQTDPPGEGERQQGQ